MLAQKERRGRVSRREHPVPLVLAWRRAIMRADYTDARFRIAVEVADHVNGDCDGCRVSIETIASITGKDRRTVQRTLRLLESDGWIEPTGSQKGGRALSTHYRLAIPERAAGVTPFAALKGGRGDALSHAKRAAGESLKGGTGAAQGRVEVEVSTTTTTARTQAQDLLTIFNEAAGSDYSLESWPCVEERVLEFPEAGLDEHRRIIEHAFRHPWWKRGAPAPGVIYGSRRQFERCRHEAATARRYTDYDT